MREPVTLDRAAIRDYAQSRTEAFGKGRDRLVRFDATLAKEDVRKADKKAR